LESTTLRSSSPRRDGCSSSTASTFRSFTATQRWFPIRIRASTSPFQSTGRACGLSLEVGSPRPHASFGREAFSHGDWIRLLRTSGFDLEDLVEVRPPAGARTRYPFVTLDWAREWPCEEVWKARKTGRTGGS
jgi:hypothetical protein